MKLLSTIFLLIAWAATAHAGISPQLVRNHGFPLDAKLREVSGLAPAGRNSVFAHGDEYAIVHEISLNEGQILRSFAFGKPTATGDYEGIARIGDAIWLVTSDGKLLEGRIEEHGKRTRFHVYDTGVGAACEIEGFAPADEAGRFYLLCKNLLASKDKKLRIYRWAIAERFAAPELTIDVPLATLAPAAAVGDFRPSELARDARSGNFLILNASGGVLEITGTGGLVRYIPLDRTQHPQPEGLALMPDGRLVIADEGGARAGALAVYRRP